MIKTTSALMTTSLRDESVLLLDRNAIGRMSETDDGQKARNACNIGTQPVRPKVYGVNAPL